MGERPRSVGASAVVTGAGSGIGRAFALALAARGGRVVCADVHGAAAEETAALVVRRGGSACASVVDVAALEDVERLLRESTAFFAGPPDLLVNNAGVGVGGLTIGALPIADWRWAVAVNLWGAIHGCHVFVPVLRAGDRGGIINVCSAASYAAAPGMGAYNVTKAAMLALSETLCAELSGSGVAVTATFPSWVRTDIAKRGRLHGHTAGLAAKLAARGCTPDHVARDALDALDAGRLYTFPQLEPRLLFHAKGLFPSGVRTINALVARAGLLDAGRAPVSPREERKP